MTDIGPVVAQLPQKGQRLDSEKLKLISPRRDEGSLRGKRNMRKHTGPNMEYSRY
ncbi:hypothetical protein NBG4_400015 [Candidatus Sulfobium mesophilum]|uniref:Uncharacterized protein n=1 Tax=Candidatus Sulfobium mesophilum TaxID=2016548 RepID=A0A2U3QI10_9BACT|nr:hypothetical protein NBG4_400015 [Candidatus Sulfobium mesophilum]